MLSWNDQIKHDSMLSTKVVKAISKPVKALGSAVAAVPGIICNIWEFLCIVVPLVICIALSIALVVLALFMVVAIPYAIYTDVKESNARERAAIAHEKELLSSGFEAIKVSSDDYNSSELLAMKRCDLKYGMNNYIFESTNFNHKVLYRATPKDGAAKDESQ